MEEIIYEDLGTDLGITRITFIRERTPEEIELNQFQNIRREEINNAVMNFHRQRELRERIMIYHVQEMLRREEFLWANIPDDFWEPVKITVNNNFFDFKDKDWECFICREQRTKQTRLKCCKQEMCDSCVDNWFTKESVKCPFCKSDIREQENQYLNE